MKICDEEDCGNPCENGDECSNCSIDLCEDHTETCEWCGEVLCTTCLDEHLAEGCPKEPPPEDLDDLEKAEMEN